MSITSSDNLFAEIRQGLGIPFTPLIFKYFSEDTNRLSTLWDVTRGNLLEGQLPRLLKEMIFVVVARTRECPYCATAHMAFCKMLGLNKNDLDILVNDINVLQPENVRLVLQFTVGLVDTQSMDNFVSRDDLLDAGMSEDDINEITSMVGFACHMTILTKGFNLDKSPDTEFKDMLKA